MSVEKLSVSLPGGLASRIDELAQADGVSRSALIQEAAAQYVASRDAHARETDRRNAVDRALSDLEEVAARWGSDDRTGVEYLAEVRGESAGPVADAGGRTSG